MSQNSNGGSNYNPYGPDPSNPHYPPAPGTGYGSGQPSTNPNYGQPPSGPNPNYGQPLTGPNPNYGQYAPPPPPDMTPNSNYGLYNPPFDTKPASIEPIAGPYDQTVFSPQSGAAYPPYPTPSNPGYPAQSSSPGYGAPVSNPAFGGMPSNPSYPAQPSSPGYGSPVSNPSFGTPGGLPPATPPVKKSNARTILVSVISFLVVLSGVLGLVFYNNHATTVRNNNATATAQIQAQTTGTAQAYASSTANAQATATYTKTHYPFSTNLVLNDPLKDNSQGAKYGWDTGGGCAFTNGAYEATESKTNFILPCTAANTNFSNFTFEIQMAIKTGGDGASGGIIFRANMGSDALYIIFLDTEGNYELDTRANSSGASTIKLRSGQVSNFATGFFQVHTIGIVANGSQLSVYIDQNKVAQTTSTTYTSGQIGVISDYGSSTTTVAYTNAKVWQL